MPARRNLPSKLCTFQACVFCEITQSTCPFRAAALRWVVKPARPHMCRSPTTWPSHYLEGRPPGETLICTYGLVHCFTQYQCGLQYLNQNGSWKTTPRHKPEKDQNRPPAKHPSGYQVLARHPPGGRWKDRPKQTQETKTTARSKPIGGTAVRSPLWRVWW